MRNVTKHRSHNLLLIKQSTLPPIDVYRNCDVTDELNPQFQAANTSQSCREESRTAKSIVTPQHFQNHYDVNNMIHVPNSILPNNELYVHQTNPPYVETPSMNIKPLMTSEMSHPTSRHYYQHLSAIAAAAWSDCNQATLKLKRIYEETAQLSRAMEPLGMSYGNESVVDRPTIVARRQLFDRTKRYMDHTMAQSARFVNGSTNCPAQTSFVEHCQRPIKNPLYFDVGQTNNFQNGCAYVLRNAGEKRKLCEIAQPPPSKIPRLTQPVPTYTVRYDDVSTPHFFTSNATIIPSQQFDSLPPPYENIQPNYNLFPGLFSNQSQSSASSFRTMPSNVGSDVIVSSSQFSDVLSLPSVSFSPTQRNAICRQFVVQ